MASSSPADTIATDFSSRRAPFARATPTSMPTGLSATTKSRSATALLLSALRPVALVVAGRVPHALSHIVELVEPVLIQVVPGFIRGILSLFSRILSLVGRILSLVGLVLSLIFSFIGFVLGLVVRVLRLGLG